MRGVIQSKALNPSTARKMPRGPYKRAARKPGQNPSGNVKFMDRFLVEVTPLNACGGDGVRVALA
jgi:hypothetical protein